MTADDVRLPNPESHSFDEAKDLFAQSYQPLEVNPVNDFLGVSKESPLVEAYFQSYGDQLEIGRLRAYLVFAPRGASGGASVVTAARYADAVEQLMLTAVAVLNMDTIETRVRQGALRVAILWFDRCSVILEIQDDDSNPLRA
jgi:hypothetical protein